jgi:hypothetical protein
MVAAAAVAAGTFLQVFLSRDVAKLKCLGDELLNFLLQLLHFFLGVEEPFGHRIVQERVALGIEGGDFLAIQGESLVLAFMQSAPLLGQALVLLLRAGVGHERIHTLADALKLRLPNDGFTQFQSLLANRVLDLGICLHKFQ